MKPTGGTINDAGNYQDTGSSIKFPGMLTKANLIPILPVD